HVEYRVRAVLRKKYAEARSERPLRSGTVSDTNARSEIIVVRVYQRATDMLVTGLHRNRIGKPEIQSFIEWTGAGTRQRRRSCSRYDATGTGPRIVPAPLIEHLNIQHPPVFVIPQARILVA